MALEKKYYSGLQVFDIIKELPEKEFMFMLNTFAKERGADVVEVVRCKDCKYYQGLAECELIGDCMGTYGFCSFGERREDAEIH